MAPLGENYSWAYAYAVGLSVYLSIYLVLAIGYARYRTRSNRYSSVIQFVCDTKMLAVSRSLENPDTSQLLTLHQTIYILMRNVRGVYGTIAPQALCGTQEQPADLIPRPRPGPCRLTRQHVSTSWLTMTPLHMGLGLVL